MNILKFAARRWPWILGALLLVASTSTATTRAATKKKLPSLKRWPDSSDKRQWVLHLAQVAGPVIAKRGFPLSVAFAQAAGESLWGTRMPDNPWGLRGKGDAGVNVITTKEEFDPGNPVTQKGQKFAKFESIEAAATAYCNFLSGKSYKAGWDLRDADDGLWLLWLWGMGYASASKYPPFIVAVANRVAVELDNPEYTIAWDSTK
ncbi:MAG: glucosaminidase domain-containing protein, partial [Candidatus Limnocylindrus sp.]